MHKKVRTSRQSLIGEQCMPNAVGPTKSACTNCCVVFVCLLCLVNGKKQRLAPPVIIVVVISIANPSATLHQIGSSCLDPSPHWLSCMELIKMSDAEHTIACNGENVDTSAPGTPAQAPADPHQGSPPSSSHEQLVDTHPDGTGRVHLWIDM